MGKAAVSPSESHGEEPLDPPAKSKRELLKARFTFNFDAALALKERRCYITPHWTTDLLFVTANYHNFVALFFQRKDSPYKKDERWVEFVVMFSVSMVFCGSDARWPGRLLKDDGSGVMAVALAVSLWYWVMRIPFALPQFEKIWIIFKIRKFFLSVMCAMSFLLLFLALALQDINEPAIWASGMFTSLLLFETVALIGWFVVWRHLEKKKYGIPMSKRVKVEEEEDDLEAEKVPLYIQNAATVVAQAAESNRRVSHSINMILSDTKRLSKEGSPTNSKRGNKVEMKEAEMLPGMADGADGEDDDEPSTDFVVNPKDLSHDLDAHLNPVVIRGIPQFPMKGGPTREDLTSWKFCVFDYEPAVLLGCVKSMLVESGCVAAWKIEPKTLDSLLLSIPPLYFSNPYHNFHHGVAVMQATYSQLYAMKASSFISPEDRFALLWAAIFHDIKHPGVNNQHMILIDSQLAKLYNSDAVLENLHYDTAMQLMSIKEKNVLSALPPKELVSVKEKIRSCILATDMSKHGPIQVAFKEWLEKGSNSAKFPDNTPADRELAMHIVLKCSDLSNAAKPWRESKIWNDRIGSEFFKQGDSEMAMGKKTADMFNRNVADPIKGSIGFIDFVARPLFTLWAKFLDVGEAIDLMDTNKRNLMEMIEERDVKKGFLPA